MAYRRILIGTTVALGAIAAVGAAKPAHAQREIRAAYTPEAGARDLRSVLFNWTSYMGMLRGVEEHELVVSLEYQGTGTMRVDGQVCALSKYRASTNYQTPGQRIQYECVLPDGRTVSNIEVVSGGFAWNEDIPGAEIVPGEGKATPMPGAVDERLIRLWASPQGAPKAALVGAGLALTAMDRNIGVLLEGGSDRIGDTSVVWQDGRPVVSFPIPGVRGATAVAMLDDRFMAEHVVVTQGGTTTEFDYGSYDDWNNPLNKIELYYAGTMQESRNGDVLRDLRTLETETGSVYVVMPVPASVGKAAWSQQFAPDRPIGLTSTAPTPRLADGKPDMTGNWTSGGMNWRYGNRRCGPTQLEGCSPAWNQTIDFELEAPTRFGPNRPVYKPEHWDRIQYLDQWTNREDPVMTCQPLGIPRQSNVRRIYQTDKDIALIYANGGDGGGGYSDMRFVPTDGREHDPQQAIQTKWTGYPVGRWEGDTLVIDSIAFVDRTWLGRGGFFHSDKMHVVERLTRQGDEILYEVTVEDPEVLAEPWVMTPKLWRANPNPDAGIMAERGFCEVYELDDITTQIRH